MDKFGEHVQRMHADRDRWFETEYNVRLSTPARTYIIIVIIQQTIEKSPQSEHEVALVLENKARNRFANIFPCTYVHHSKEPQWGVEASNPKNVACLS